MKSHDSQIDLIQYIYLKMKTYITDMDIINIRVYNKYF